MNVAMVRLRKYQSERFDSRPISLSYDGFDRRAYPQTAEGRDLDLMAEAIKLEPREENESCDSFREKIILHLSTQDSQEELREDEQFL